MKQLSERSRRALQSISRAEGYLCPALVFFICAYAMCLRLTTAGRNYIHVALGETETGLMGDSFGQVSQMNVPFLAMLKELPKYDLSGYLSGDHILVYPFFKLFGENIWGLAIPHIIVTVIGFYILYILCKQYFESIWGYVITFGIVCFNETLIWHATEIRPYAVFPTLALAALYFSELLVSEGRYMSMKKKAGIGAYFVLLIWFHTMGILILVFPLAYALLSKVRDPEFLYTLRSVAKFLFIVFLIALPFWFYSQSTTRILDTPSIWGKLFSSSYNTNTYEYIANPLVDPIEFLRNVCGNLIGKKPLYFLLLGVFFPFILNHKDRVKQMTFLIVAVFLPLLAIWLHAVMKNYWFIQRTFIWVMPLFALFLGWSWESLYRHLVKRKDMI
jgi:4-amino-4-deoxy-L-arabinose transferase-like glycosyltransferase